MKITFNSNEVTAINSYVNAVSKSIAKATNLLNMVTGSSKSVPADKEITLNDWSVAASEARASGIVEEATLHVDGSYSIEFKEEFVIGTLNISRRLFDKYMDMTVTVAVMAKQMFSGFQSEMFNIFEEELGDFKRTVQAKQPELRAKEVEAYVVEIELAAEAGASSIEVGNLIIGFKHSYWVNKAQAQRLIAAVNTYIVVPGTIFADTKDDASTVRYAITYWTDKASDTDSDAE